eukprot:3091012-Alexandrium_andersonii.AAC.1
MSASLVGSEMCIRDRGWVRRPTSGGRGPEHCRAPSHAKNVRAQPTKGRVSGALLGALCGLR